MPSTTTRPPVPAKGHLLRILGVGFGIAVIVGGAIGSGILRTPGLVAAQLGSPRIIIAVWLMGGIYAFCCTLSVIELGTMLPRAGGWYVYSRRAFGEYAGFLVGCIDWIAQPVAIAYLAVAFADFAAELQTLITWLRQAGIGRKRSCSDSDELAWTSCGQSNTRTHQFDQSYRP